MGTHIYEQGRAAQRIRIVFDADTAIVLRSNEEGLGDVTEYCSWATFNGTVRLNCPHSTGMGDVKHTINYVYDVRIDGFSMSGTMRAPDHDMNGSVSLTRE